MASMTAGDVLVETLIDWGVDTVFGIPGDGGERDHRGVPHAPGQGALHPDAARGVGRLHGLRLGEVHRQARGLRLHVRAGRHPPPERALRRQAGRPAGAGDHRAAVPRPDRHLHPAGRGARPAVHGRDLLQRPRHGAGARGERGRAGLPLRPGLSRRGAHHHGRRPPVRGGEEGCALRAQHQEPRLQRPRAQPAPAGGGRPGRGGGGPERLRQGRHPGGAGGARRLGRPGGGGGAAECSGGQGPARQGGPAGRPSQLHRRGWAFSAPRPRRRRWRPARPC